MTFSTIETSRDDGRPIELYDISYTANVWHYTSADRDIVYNGVTYKSVPISRSDVQSSGDPTKATLSVTVAADSPLGDVFRIQPPSEPVILTIYGEHFLDNSVVVLWKGRITGSEWQDSSVIELTSESVFSSLQRPGLRRRFQAQCQFSLYGTDCGVSKVAHKETMTVSALAGLTLTGSTAAGKINNWYAGGYVTWINNVNNNTERRMIRASTGSTGQMTLSATPLGLQAGQTIDVYPGCDHTLDGANGCSVKFVNFVRFGGLPFMPSKNPFNGSTIY